MREIPEVLGKKFVLLQFANNESHIELPATVAGVTQ